MTHPGPPKGDTVTATSHHQRARKRVGDATEDHVAALNAACRLARVADLHKVPTDVVVQRAGSRIVGAFYRQRATVDYLGIMLDGSGRGVAVEVKHVELGKRGPSLPLSRLEAHQRDALEVVDRAGGVAVVLVVAAGRLYAVPWSMVAACVAAGERSLSPAVLAGCVARGVYLERWISPSAPARVKANSAPQRREKATR